MQQPSAGPGQAPFPASSITTELIQKYLDENKQLILAILDNQSLGKLTECAHYQARLQQNLMFLAAIADAQPQAPPPPPPLQQQAAPASAPQPSYNNFQAQPQSIYQPGAQGHAGSLNQQQNQAAGQSRGPGSTGEPASREGGSEGNRSDGMPTDGVRRADNGPPAG